jgi:DNA-binding transcriptional LysR family regulator
LDIARQLDVDALLLPALTKFGWMRLQRFATIAGYPNIGHAASAIGCRPDTLRGQVQLLERDFGRRLIERASGRTKPMRLTAFGVGVTNAVRRVERQPSQAAARRRPARRRSGTPNMPARLVSV